jgi:hypothetical protein
MECKKRGKKSISNKLVGKDLENSHRKKKNIVAGATGNPGFVNFRVRYPMTGTERGSKWTSLKYKPKSVHGIPTTLVITN